MQNLSCENEFYLHDNKTNFHINAFALTGLQITVGHQTLADQNLLVQCPILHAPYRYHKSKIFEFLSLQKLEELEKEEELREAAGLYDSEPVRECRSNF